MGKCTTRPGPRARSVSPARHGDHYSYVVDKLWIVGEVRTDGRLALVTRRGKRHVVSKDDPRLRKPNWWERILFRRRFPAA
ncbi:MAG: hypothetical protein KDB80_12650, partial [Planctomycetes bacterium]|nr:hypothetical protein [Planctomycetota bacterium]